jgi:hypothetical protein
MANETLDAEISENDPGLHNKFSISKESYKILMTSAKERYH